MMKSGVVLLEDVGVAHVRLGVVRQWAVVVIAKHTAWRREQNLWLNIVKQDEKELHKEVWDI